MRGRTSSLGWGIIKTMGFTGNKVNRKLIFWILAILLVILGAMTLVLSGAPAFIFDPDPEIDLGFTSGFYVPHISH
jgi:hypothetical protein